MLHAVVCLFGVFGYRQGGCAILCVLATASAAAFGRKEGTLTVLRETNKNKEPEPRTCQGLSNYFGITSNMPFPACAPQGVRDWWISHGCTTSAQVLRCNCGTCAHKVLIVDPNHMMHAKNRGGMERMLRHLGWSFSYGTAADVTGHDVVWSPLAPLHIEKYPGVKFIFGPQFSNLPDNRFVNVNNANYNGVYIIPSAWVVRLWRSRFKPVPHITLPLERLPFPVDTDKFAPKSTVTSRNLVVVYFKFRAEVDLEAVRAALRHETVKEFSYFGRYNEADYLDALQHAKYGIIVDGYESQGFAIEEALSCDVPLLVWNTYSMRQVVPLEWQGDDPCTTVPYWSQECGEIVTTKEEMESVLSDFARKVSERAYTPRKYVLRELSTKKCAQNLVELLETIVT